MNAPPWDRVKAELAAPGVAELLGLEPGREPHKWRPCPECGSSETPALHGYPEPGKGFFCFSCDQAWTVIDMAAVVWGVEPTEACERLAATFGIPSENGNKPSGLTVPQYAAAFKLPVEWLTRAGLKDMTWCGAPAVAIPYRGADGKVTTTRYRTALTGSRFRWQKGSTPSLYGLPGLAHAREQGSVVIVEGESDVHVLAYHKVPGVGVPGTGTWRAEWAALLDGIETVYIVDEGDEPSQKLIAAVAASVGDRLRVVRIEGAKDPAELHVKDPEGFPAAFQAALAAAKPIAEPEKPKEKPKEKTQGSAILLTDPEPWDDPVNGADVLDELVFTFTRFLALPAHAAEALALWTMHAHAHDAAEVSPVLALTSPVKRCGKSTTLHVLAAVTPRPLSASNVTAATVFRAVEKYAPVLLVDEADTFLRDNEELRGVLNSGHARHSAAVIRCVGEKHEARIFRTWCPKAIALIGRLPDTLADRSIEVAMQRRAPGEAVERLRLDRMRELEPMRRRAWTWAHEHAEALLLADPEVPATLNDRAADNWRPLLAIADVAGDDWPTRARKASQALSGRSKEEDEPARVLALGDVVALFEERGAEVLASEEIVAHLVTLEARPWPEWHRNGKALSTRGLAKLLGWFGVGPTTVRIGDRTPKGYRVEDLREPAARYLGGSLSSLSATALLDNDLDDFLSATSGGHVADRESRNSLQGNDVADVADTDSLLGGEAEMDSFWNEGGRDTLDDDEGMGG